VVGPEVDQRGDVLTDVVDLLRDAATSPWVYAILFAVALLDAFFPVVPSETAVITAGVFAVTGDPSLAGVIAVAAAGAFAGDHVSYVLGRASGGRLRRRRRFPRRTIARHGATMLIAARFVPGGRTATTLLMGAGRYPRRAFAGYDAIAVVAWATYAAMLGFLGGNTFADDPLRGVLVGFAAGLVVSLLLWLGRYMLQRVHRDPAPLPRRTVEYGQSLRLDRRGAHVVDR
jgi:membrane-associated protein